MADDRPILIESPDAVDGHSPSDHERMVANMVARGAISVFDGATPLSLAFNDPEPLVAAWVRDLAGRELGASPTWVRFARSDLGRGAVFVLHEPRQSNEAELIVVAQPGVLTRRVLRQAAHWAFVQLRLARVVVRCRADRPDLMAFAEFVGFRHVGIAPRFFGARVDASVWAMLATECPWLRAPPPAPAADASPSLLSRMH